MKIIDRVIGGGVLLGVYGGDARMCRRGMNWGVMRDGEGRV